MKRHIFFKIFLKVFIILIMFNINCSKKDIIKIDDNENQIILPDGYENRWFEGLRYGLFVPPSYDSTSSYPLIIRLHGYTDTVSWNLNWYNEPIISEDPCLVFTPKSTIRSAWGSSWDDYTPYPLKISLQVIDSLISEFNIDTTRIYIHGTSMGGYGVFNLLYRFPQRFAAAIAICGGGKVETAEMVMQTPLWIFHGSEDDVVDISYSMNIYERIVELGGEKTRYTEYPGVGHDAWTPAWQESTLVDWFLAQQRGKNYLRPDYIMNLKHEFTDSIYIKLTWDKLNNIPKTKNWIWYLELYRNERFLTELGPNQTTYVDSTRAGGSDCRYSIVAVNYYFKKSLPRELVVVYPD